jgi:hypothetical protein
VSYATVSIPLELITIADRNDVTALFCWRFATKSTAGANRQVYLQMVLKRKKKLFVSNNHIYTT